MIEIDDLENKYTDMTKNKFIGGGHLLEDLEKTCREIGKKYNELAAPLFVLNHIFKEVRDDQYQRIVTVEECNDLYNHLNEPIINLINDMKNETDFLQNLNKLILIFNNLYYK